MLQAPPKAEAELKEADEEGTTCRMASFRQKQ